MLIRKFRKRERDARAARKLFSSAFTLVTPQLLEQPVSRDPDDDIVLATAIAGECAALVTSDQDLLTLDPVPWNVPSPSKFWKWEADTLSAGHR